jgi:hypothetical protein
VTKKRPQKPYWEMNTQELREATKEFDEEFVIDKCTPLTPEMRARWEAVQRKLSRPKRDQDVRKISISVHKDLLVRADALAKKMGLTREGLFARGLKAVLAAEGEI